MKLVHKYGVQLLVVMALLVAPQEKACSFERIVVATLGVGVALLAIDVILGSLY